MYKKKSKTKFLLKKIQLFKKSITFVTDGSRF